MANHSISIALCTYNGAAYIAEQLDSILGQTLPPDEIVIVDDGSTDDTPGIVRGYAEKYGNIHFFENEERLGFVRNFSRAISLTKGDYVALSDQDDIWTENHLEVLLSHIGDKAVCVGDAVMIGPDGRETGRKFSEIKENYFIPDRDVSKAYRIIYN
jgi:glycosyltransferase involved in cell wall biosynthesis